MMTRRWFSLLTLLAAATLVLPLLAGPAAAQSLDELRASGKVGERYDGFAEARDPAVAAQVKEINAKRTAIYQQQADKEGVPLAEVGKVYAIGIVKPVPEGNWLVTADGQWRRKEASTQDRKRGGEGKRV